MTSRKDDLSSGYADLHLHTTASDGTLAPDLLVKKAKEAGFAAIAITDHDNVNGLAEAAQAGAELNLEVIPGIELAALDGELEVHILGYFIDRDNPQLNAVMAKLVESRRNRAADMVQKLNTMGLGISLARVQELAGGEVIGRPHIARAMQEKGLINKLQEAFSNAYIGRGGKAYVERYKLTPAEAIKLLKQAGGIPVLAHPGYLSDRTILQEEKIKEYIVYGLQGLEVFYSQHTPAQVNYYFDLAQKYKLLVTGGSDSHGDLDRMLGSIKLPYKYVEALKTAYSHNNSPCGNSGQ